jgi:hypothetical protein
MRAMLCGALLFAMAGCSQAPPQQSAAEGCTRTATHDVGWTNEQAPDTITARSEGPSCAQAIVVLTVRNSGGDPLWTFASTFYDMTTGGWPLGEVPPVTDARMDEFLASWANVSAMRSGALPAWREGAASLTDSAEGLAYSTAFERETYEAMRGRNLPLICYAAAAEASQCLMIDPASMSPAVLVFVSP